MSPIDLVYCWCDDADPKWRAKRMAALPKFLLTVIGDRFDP